MLASDVIESHLVGADAYVTWSVLATKRPAGGPAFKGGVSTWPKLERELRLLLRDSSTTVLTTLLDYYAFPSEAPGMADRPHGSPHDRVRHVESALAKAIDDARFVPNLVLHETETWVLADCRRLGEMMGDPGPAADLERIVQLDGQRRCGHCPLEADHERVPALREDDRRPSRHCRGWPRRDPEHLPARRRLAPRA